MNNDLISFLSPAFTKKILVIWDLDGTLIDASHRVRFDEKGNFDLDYWVSHSVPSEIAQDKLLPLSSIFYGFSKTGFTQILLTARIMSDADFAYLRKHNLTFDMILHRETSKDLDEVLKSKQVQDFLAENDLIPFMAFDDKQENLEVFDKLGFRTIHAGYLNEKLKIGKFSELQGLLPKQFVK